MEENTADKIVKPKKAENKSITSKVRPLTSKCGVCGSPSTHVRHYGSVTCYSCRAFFRRSVARSKAFQYCLTGTDSCQMEVKSRNMCKKCRYKACIKIGMQPHKVDRNKRKQDLSSTFYNNQDPVIRGEEAILCSDTVFCTRETSKQKSFKNVAEYSVLPLASSEPLDSFGAPSSSKSDSPEPPEPIASLKNPENDSTDGDMVRAPNLECTLEEEYRVHEVIVTKESHIATDTILRSRNPYFLQSLKIFLDSLCSNDRIRTLFPTNQATDQLFYEKGRLLHFEAEKVAAIEVYEHFQNRESNDKIINETLEFSLPVFHLCLRGYQAGNKNCSNIISQHKAAGTYNDALLQAFSLAYSPDIQTLNSIPSFDPLNLDIFESPWCQSQADEILFMETLHELGNEIKDDNKLGSLYLYFVLVIPAPDSKHLQADPTLQKLQSNISLMMYRYLKQKHKSEELASSKMNKLLRLIGKLHICRDIHLNRRITSEVGQYTSAAPLLWPRMRVQF